MSATRRGVLAAIATAPLAALPAVAEPHADAELLALGAEFARLTARAAEIDRLYGDAVDVPDAITDEGVARAPVMHALAERIADLPATTLAGLRIKAAVVLRHMPLTYDGQLQWENYHELAAWSLARDLLGDDAARPHGTDYEGPRTFKPAWLRG